MLTFKKITAIFVLTVLPGVAGVLFAQSIESPSMPTITMPDMPTISSPTMDGKFYRPSLPKQEKKSDTKTDSNSTESKTNEAVLSDGTTTDDILISLLSNANLLSASDISDLYDTGSFNTLSSLSGVNGISGNSSSSSELSTNILLRQILEKLNELKESFNEEIKENEDTKLGDLYYHIKVDEKTGEFIIVLGDKTLFRGIEGNFSILNLFSSLNIKYILQQVDELPNESDENLDEIKV